MRKNGKVKGIIIVLCLLLSMSACGKSDITSNEYEEPINDTDVTSQTAVEDLRPSIEEEMALVESEFEPVKSQEEIEQLEVKKNPFTNLNVPTDVEKIGDTYFIVDCYNNQVIYSDDIQAPLSEWNVMCDDMSEGHTIASDGEVYLIDDTENNRVLVYRKVGDKFLFVQTLNHIGERPHYIRYDEKSDAFYVLSSMTGELYILKSRGYENTDQNEKINENMENAATDHVNEAQNTGGEIYVEDIKRFDNLAATYCRSFTILGNKIILPASNGLILEASFPECEVSATYQAPGEVAGLVQVYAIDDILYITVSTDGEGSQDHATILSTRSFSELQEGNYVDLYDALEPERASVGTPYNISAFDGHYYLVEHRHGHGLFQFDVEEDTLKDVTIIQ